MGEKGKLQLVRRIGQRQHKGRTYRVERECLIETGQEYTSIKLYNERGKFIKRFAMEPEVAPDIGQILNWANMNILDALVEAEAKAWDALSRYKFWMFGYWSAIWVHLNHLAGLKLPNPWKKIVGIAKKEVGSEKVCRQHSALFLDS